MYNLNKTFNSSFLSLLLILCISCTSCSVFVPVNSDFETAETLGKDNIAVQGQISKTKLTQTTYQSPCFFCKSRDLEKAKENQNRHLGLKLAYGVSKKADFSIEYRASRVNVQEAFSIKDGQYFMDQVSVAMKTTLVPNLAVKGKVGFYKSRNQLLSKENKSPQQLRLAVFEPQIIYSTKFLEDKLEPYVNLKGQFIGGSNLELIQLGVGLNTGFGFSTNPDKWTVRTEVGILGSPKTSTVSGGMSFTYFFKQKTNSGPIHL